jgi:hypothetical protein
MSKYGRWLGLAILAALLLQGVAAADPAQIPSALRGRSIVMAWLKHGPLGGWRLRQPYIRSI